MTTPPLAPRPRRHVRCLGCSVPPGELCRECSASGDHRLLVSGRAASEAIRRVRRRHQLLTAALLGALLGSCLLWAWLVWIVHYRTSVGGEKARAHTEAP